MPTSFIRNSVRSILAAGALAIFSASIAQTDSTKVQSEFDAIKPSEWTNSVAPSIGSVSAPIKVVFFVDYECPSCRTADAVVRQTIAKRSDVALIYREFPLYVHQFAKPAAIVAENARAHGTFNIAHKVLMEGKALTENSVKVAAHKAGVSTIATPAIASLLASDQAFEKKVKLTFVPCFIVIQNGKSPLMNKAQLLDFLK